METAEKANEQSNLHEKATADKGSIKAFDNKGDSTIEKKKQGTIVKKDYVLNDLEALKKKLANEKRQPEVGISGEASNGACTTVCMKTSLSTQKLS